MSALRAWEVDDLVQEVYLKALVSLESYSGRASLKTWTLSVANNHLMSMARAAKRHPSLLGDASFTPSNHDQVKRLILRTATKELLAWLRENPEEIEHGWAVLNLLLWTHGNHDYVALAMTIHTRSPWTTERVRTKVREIQTTTKGRALCEALGLTKEED